MSMTHNSPLRTMSIIHSSNPCRQAHAKTPDSSNAAHILFLSSSAAAFQFLTQSFNSFFMIDA